MAKTELVAKKTELQLINDTRPSYLAEIPDEDRKKGTEGMNKVIRPSFLKIVQSMTPSEIKKQFGEGSIILIPDMMGICGLEEKVSFVPILWWQEWCKWAPRALSTAGTEPMIVERSFDPKSKLAIKASSPSTWKEPHPKYPGDDNMCYKYQEHLNYLVKLVREDLADLPPCLVSFSKSNYKTGTTLNRISLRRNAPLCSMQFRLGVKEKTNSKGTFFINTVEDDQDHMWADGDFYRVASELHDEFEALLHDKQLEGNYDDNDGDVVDASSTESAAGNNY